MVSPLDAEIAKIILAVGLFVPSSDSNRWTRLIEEEATTVTAILNEGHLRLELSPLVNQYYQHAQKRISAGVYFEIAAKYAEKVGGEIKQLSNVQGCTEGGVAEHILAKYPEIPLQFARICHGFQETLLPPGETAA